jgi:NitT/TauT family transport system ATP-binding protein
MNVFPAAKPLAETTTAVADGAVAPAARQPSPLLEIKGLRYAYDSARPVLDDLSMVVNRGEFVALIGPSGSGKSTLLRLLSGIAQPSAGEVRLNGTPVLRPRRDIGMVFQKPTLLPWRNVLDNVLLPAGFATQADAGKRADAERLLTLVGLGDVAHLYPHQLSGGMAQRVGLARMLLYDPALLLLDEPFAALDAMTRENLSFELQSLTRDGKKTALIVTHSIPEAVLLSDRILMLAGQPARVVAEIAVPLPYPRTIDTLAGADFNLIARDLRRLFQQHASPDAAAAASRKDPL